MENVKPFFDLGVSEKCMESHYEHTVKLLHDFGYRTIAINQIVDADRIESEKPKKGKKKGETREKAPDPVPEPFEIRPVKGCEDMKILNRLTIAFSNQAVIHKIIKSPNYVKFHLIAAQPTTTQAFTFCCETFKADILSSDSENRVEMKKNRKLYNKLINERGYHIEICYSEAIDDSSRRKHIIYLSHVYHALFKSKNIIVSSGATRPMLIRSPYDVINLGFLFGLSEQQSKSAITDCARDTYINSVGRCHGKAVMIVEKSEETKENTTVILLESSSDSDVLEVQDLEEPSAKKHRHT